MAETVILYSTGCPKCKVLMRKLESKGIEYFENTNVEEMLSLGMKSAPHLMVDDEILDFNKAVAWINKQ